MGCRQSWRPDSAQLWNWKLRRLHEQARDKQYEPTKEIDALLYYLRHGFLPRWAIVLIKQVYDIAAAAIESAPERLKRFLYAHVHEYKVWDRIRTQFSLEVTDTFINIIPELAQARETLSTSWTEWYTGDNIDRIPWGGDEAEQAISEVVLMDAQNIMLGTKDEKSIFEDLLIHINHVPGNMPGGGEGMIKRPETAPAFFQENSNPSDAVIPIVLESEFSPGLLTSLPTIAHSEIEAKIPTRTSGLVLLYPFLKPFFTELDFIRDGNWTDDLSQQRAIHILHFLGTGAQEQGEWNLLLEKLMCGLAPDFPIERRILITEKEIAECNALLEAVIEHWTALKKTSPRALQETFLKRDGLLSKTEKGWLLQIERKTQDILLEALPWSYSMMRLSWNEYLIEVLW